MDDLPVLNCPWSSWTPGSTQFCEAPLCAWVESPGIAWAGFIYIAIGLYIYFSNKNQKSPSWLLNLFPFFAIMMGLGSLLYHSSHAFIFQAWDVGAMFLLGSALFGFNLIQLRWLPESVSTQKKIFIFAIVIEMLIFIIFRKKMGPLILGTLILFFLLTEIWIFMRAKFILRQRKYLWLSLGLFALGGAALWIEHRSGLCDPDNHIFQWHAVWDGFSAITYFTLFKYFQSSAYKSLK